MTKKEEKALYEENAAALREMLEEMKGWGYDEEVNELIEDYDL